MRQRGARLTGRPARGAATLEVAAAYGLAALLVAALLLALVGSSVPGIAARAICVVRSAVDGDASGCAPATEVPPPVVDPSFDPEPARCKVNETSEKVNAQIKIAFISFGENAGFVETTYSDGTVTYTATDGASLGVTGGFGGRLDIGKVQRGAKVDFGAGVTVDYGSTWVFEDADEAEEMREQLDQYLVEQETLKHDSSGGYAIYLAITGGTDPPDAPTLQVSTFEVNADVSGSVGLSLPFDPGSTEGPALTLAQAGLKFGGTGRWTLITDADSGATTYVTGGEVYGQVSGQVGPAAGELKGVLGSSMAITRDEDGQITRVSLVTTREGKATGTLNSGQGDLGGNASDSSSASDVTVTTTTLDVTTQDQRDLVDAWLAAQADPEAAVSPQTFFPDRMVPGDAFQNLMYTNATVSNVQYDNVSDKTGFAAEVKLGLAFGIDLSLETTDSTAVDATYLDVPGADGIRPPVDFPACEAG